MDIKTTVIPPQSIPGRYDDPTPVSSRQQQVEDLSNIIWEDREPEEVGIEFAYHLSSLDGDPFYIVANLEEDIGHPLALPPEY